MQAEAAHKALLATKAKLEYDIHVKTISLEIDTSKCMHGRQVGYITNQHKAAALNKFSLPGLPHQAAGWLAEAAGANAEGEGEGQHYRPEKCKK